MKEEQRRNGDGQNIFLRNKISVSPVLDRFEFLDFSCDGEMGVDGTLGKGLLNMDVMPEEG